MSLIIISEAFHNQTINIHFVSISKNLFFNLTTLLRGKNNERWIIFFACSLFLLTSCETEMDKYYELPSWLKGNSWEVLESKGNFSIFLKGVEKTSYKDLIQGKGQITVMAPTDEAFKAYFAKRKINSLDDLSANELDKLIAYHLVYYSFTKERFENYNPEGVDAESETTSPGLFYKFRTKSRDEITTDTDFIDNNRIKKVMHKERFLPVFSYNLFNSKHINAKSNYEYFYPESTWSGDNGFNVSNATVNEYGIVTDNGYVYTLNQVVTHLKRFIINCQKLQTIILLKLSMISLLITNTMHLQQLPMGKEILCFCIIIHQYLL